MAERVTVKARHAVVSDQCRAKWGEEVAVDLALSRLRESALRLFKERGEAQGDQFHFKLEIERDRQL